MELIKKFFLTGDTHGRVVERLETLKSKYPDLRPAETALIILGDAGFNFYLNKSDYKNKKQVNDMGYIVTVFVETMKSVLKTSLEWLLW